MNKREFFEYSKRLYHCYNLFLEYYYDKEFELFLASGKSVAIKIEEENLPHLLGLIPAKLKKLSVFRNLNLNVDCMKKIMMNPKKCCDCIDKELGDDYFSFFWRKKTASFQNLGQLNCKNIAFTFFYNSDVVPRDNYRFVNCEFMIGIEHYNNTSIIGLKKSDNFYVPVTNLLVPNDNLDYYTQNQILIPTFCSVEKELKDNKETKVFCSQDEVIKRMESMNRIKESGKFLAIDVSGEYLSTLNKLEELETNIEQLEQVEVPKKFKFYSDYLSVEEVIILSKYMYPDIDVEIELFAQATNALTKKEVSLIRDVIIDKKDSLSNLADKHGFNSYQTMNKHIKKSLKFLGQVYGGLILQDPYCSLLCDRLSITKEVLNLEEKKRNLMLLKFPLLDELRLNKKEIIETLGITTKIYNELECEAIKELTEIGRKYQKAMMN